MVLIWWVRKDCTPGQEDMLERTRWLMNRLEEEGTDIMLSSVSLAEFLRGSSPDQAENQFRIIRENFLVQPFDAMAAQQVASAFGQAISIGEYVERKTAMKADILIVGTALAHGADVIYSHDRGLRKLAGKAGLQAEDIPAFGNSLFDLIEDDE